MDVHVIVKLKSSYQDWHNLFLKDADNRSNICDESRTLVGQVNESTAVITLFEVNKAAMEDDDRPRIQADDSRLR